MRMILSATAFLVCSPLFATEKLVDKPAGMPLAEAETRAFGLQLLRVCDLVTAQYVRPVSRAELAQAALEGLYEAARVPAPASLTGELAQVREELENVDALFNWVPLLPQRYQPQAWLFVRDLHAAVDVRWIAVFARARQNVGDQECLRGRQALFQSVRAMTRVLDPYSGLVNEREWNRGSSDEFEPSLGLDVDDNLGVGPLFIRNVVPGSPAQRAGLRPGDRITHVSGKSVAGNSSAAQLVLAQHISPALERGKAKAPAGVGFPTPIELTVVRDGREQPFRVKLLAEPFKGETVLGVIRDEHNGWDYWIDRKHKIAQVRIASLAAGTAEDVAQVVRELEAQGMRGLVLDVRWCPGGFLNEAVNTALLFVGQNKVAMVRSRDGREIEYAYVADSLNLRPVRDRAAKPLPLVVLVNGATSGGAELIAAAVQDNHCGLVAGQRTLGKASVQSPLDLIDEVKLKLTTATFFRPSGKNLNRFPNSRSSDEWGVRPDADLEMRASADLDRQLRAWWQLQTLRPGSSFEALPLDDPAADPQRQVAVDALLALQARKKQAAIVPGK